MKIIVLSSSILYFIMNVASCSQGDPEPTPSPSALVFTDASFSIGEPIPAKYTCAVSQQKFPMFKWVPSAKKTSSYVLIMDDPDAVPVVGYVWNHWLLYNIPSDVNLIPEGTDIYGPLPSGVVRGKTSFGDTAYGGPCPPTGQKHTYVFTLYGLDMTDIGVGKGATSAQVRSAMKGHILDSTVYKGTCIR